jgi:two-component system, response regulator YesN
MYSVVVVDDEPSSLKHICMIIELKCKGFKVIGQAENGKSGFEMVKELRPDLLISDVKMPLVNGIELASLVRNEFPECLTVLVSGFQDFEYMKGAIQSGVCDYIIKPLTPSNLQSVLKSIECKLDVIYYQNRNELIRKLSKGIGSSQWSLNKYFQSERYYVALIRRNGLPKRFYNGTGVEVFSELKEKLFVYGRDEMEELYIVPEEIVFNNDFKQFVKNIVAKMKTEQQYITVTITLEPMQVYTLTQKIQKLYRELDTKSVVGVNQFLIVDEKTQVNTPPKCDGEEVLHLLGVYIKDHRYDSFKIELERLLQVWQSKKMPQLWVEGMIRRVFYMLQNSNNTMGNESECEFMLDDAFFYSTSNEELLESIYFIMDKYLLNKPACVNKVDSPEFLEQIKRYLNKHMSEEITLQKVCNTFSVSQTCLSRIFRKYENTSFNNYLTNVRIERAKEYMEKDKNFFVKDIAGAVGYKDQFYFSRIFRSVTGVCPSDYVECNNEV